MSIRWMTVDPTRYGANWYQYVSREPVNLWDPLGLCGVDFDESDISIKLSEKAFNLAGTMFIGGLVATQAIDGPLLGPGDVVGALGIASAGVVVVRGTIIAVYKVVTFWIDSRQIAESTEEDIIFIIMKKDSL